MRRKITFADLSAHVQEVFSNLCKDGVTPEENYEGFKKLTYDLNHNPNEMFDDEGNKIPNRRFIGKNSKCHTVYKRMANGFIMTSNIICRKHNRKHKQHKNYAA